MSELLRAGCALARALVGAALGVGLVGRVEIVSDVGKRVIGRWRETDG